MFDGGSILDTLIACEMHFTDGLYIPCTFILFCLRKEKKATSASHDVMYLLPRTTRQENCKINYSLFRRGIQV